MVYQAEIGHSASNKHSLLIYRSTTDPTRCFKFYWKKSNQLWLSYICLGCEEARDKGNVFELKSIRVSLDEGQFLSNPEALSHQCTDLGFTFEYMAVDVQQELR